MKQWTREIEINAPIDDVWSLFNGSLEDMQKIMPQVVDQKPIKITDNKIGSVYRQKFKEGKRIEEYDITTIDYVDELDEKRLKVGFTLAKLFEITALYELRKINDQKTLLQYTATNKPLKWFLKLFLIFSSDKVVIQFLERVKAVAEGESGQT